jgi:uncharacterized protein (DUF3820 family)
MNDPEEVAEALATWRMPFGKYQNWRLIDLPLEYLLWFKQKGWPEGKLGYLLQAVCDAKGECGEAAFDHLRFTPRREGAPAPKKRLWKLQ